MKSSSIAKLEVCLPLSAWKKLQMFSVDQTNTGDLETCCQQGMFGVTLWFSAVSVDGRGDGGAGPRRGGFTFNADISSLVSRHTYLGGKGLL